MRKPTRPDRTTHRGLTLIELLVSISLITVVSSMFLVAYRQASAEASNIRTQSTIRKISEVLVSRMQEYENYPINFARGAGNVFAVPIPGNAVEVLNVNNDAEFEPKGILLERLRVMLLREMIAQEMPDHYQDIKTTLPVVRNYWTGLQAPNPNANGVFAPVVVTASESPRAARIKARLTQVNPNWRQQLDSIDPDQNPAVFQVANAEFLYLIVEDSNLNGSPAIELFGKTEIGDTDNDGLLEFLDANRQPICWVRWPTGFPDTTRFHPDLLHPSFNRDGFANYAFSDPLDPRKADPGYRIKAPNTKVYKPSAIAFPLVISSGVDRDAKGGFGFGVKLWHRKRDPGDLSNLNSEYRLLDTSASVTDVNMPVPYAPAGITMCDPWFPRTDATRRLGAINPLYPKAFEDDITNYSINGAYQ
ncbi:MAG: prepilin-type N-terminal cleavage/methylation domain-containing protein [Pirellula sp.]